VLDIADGARSLVCDQGAILRSAAELLPVSAAPALRATNRPEVILSFAAAG